MITGIITFLIIFSVIGSILYGQRLIKTENLMQFLEILKEQKVGCTGL